MSKGSNGWNERSCQPKVSNFESSISGNQNILRFEVPYNQECEHNKPRNHIEDLINSPMHYTSHMAVLQSFQQLAGVRLHKKTKFLNL